MDTQYAIGQAKKAAKENNKAAAQKIIKKLSPRSQRM